MIDFDATALAAAEAAFAEQVGWYASDYPAATVNAIFFDSMPETKFQDSTEVTNVVSLLGARAGQFPRLPAQGDLFNVRGRFYVASEVQPDGVGSVKIRIRLATDLEARRAAQAPVPTA